MKKIEAIIQPHKFEDAKEALKGSDLCLLRDPTKIRIQSTHATNTLEHNCTRFAVAHLALFKRRTGSAISAT